MNLSEIHAGLSGSEQKVAFRLTTIIDKSQACEHRLRSPCCSYNIDLASSQQRHTKDTAVKKGAFMYSHRFCPKHIKSANMEGKKVSVRDEEGFAN